MLPELGRGSGILPLSPQAIDEVWLVMNLQLFLHHPALPVQQPVLRGGFPPSTLLPLLAGDALNCCATAEAPAL